jgi:hypothetical protein
MDREELKKRTGGMNQHLGGASDSDYFGVCPKCGKNDGYINIGRGHWFFCTEHKIRWCAGANLFSSWQDETEEQPLERYNQLGFDKYITIPALHGGI